MSNLRLSFLRLLAGFWQNQKGATAIEYVVIAAFLSIAIAVTVTLVGDTLDNDYFQAIANSF